MAGKPASRSATPAVPPPFKIETFSVALPATLPQQPDSAASPPNYRRQVPAEEWETLKPLIKQLYIDNNNTFEEVARTFRDEHNFSPTKRQFDARIKKWGIKKNTKRSERREILDALSAGDRKPGTRVGNVTLTPIKLKRWEMELKGDLRQVSSTLEPYVSRSSEDSVRTPLSHTLSEGSTLASRSSSLSFILSHPSSPSDQENYQPVRTPLLYSPLAKDTEDLVTSFVSTVPNVKEESLPEEPVVVSDGTEEQQKNITIWDSADITRSPALTGLFGAMKIDEEFPLLPPSADSSSNPPTLKSYISFEEITYPEALQNGIISRVRARENTDDPNPKRRKGLFFSPSEEDITPTSWLFNHISPFPNHNTKSYKFTAGQPPGKSMIRQLSESQKRLQKLEKLLSVDNPGVIYELQRLARLSFQGGEFKKAEPLYLRLARSKQRRIGREHPETVAVYLDLVENKIDGGELVEADRLHEAIHSRILQLFGVDSELAIRSLLLLANIRYYLPKEHTQESANMLRKALQIALNTFGMRHPIISHIMVSLVGSTIGKRSGWDGNVGLLQAADQLIQKSLDLEFAIGNQTDRSEIYKLHKLAIVYEQFGKWKESIDVTRKIVRRIRVLYGYEHPSILGCLRSLAKSYRCTGDFAASENASRHAISSTMKSPGWDEKETIRYKDTVDALEELAEALKCLKRWDEASIRFEEVYRCGGKDRVLDDEREVVFRKSLRECYSMQGLYPESNDFDARMGLLMNTETITTFYEDNKIRKWGRFESELDEEEDIGDQPGKRVCLGWSD